VRALMLGLVLLAIGAPQAVGVELRVRFDDVLPAGGTVRVGLFASTEGFARRHEGVVASRTVPAGGDTVEVAFTDLAPGRYAVTAYHDANDNRRLDRVLGLLPREGVALSNNPPLWRAPDFDALAVEVNADTRVTVRFVYPAGG